MTEDLTIRRLAEKIAKDFQLSVKERTDAILEMDAIQYQNLGIDVVVAIFYLLFFNVSNFR
jgi:hypothetical protein